MSRSCRDCGNENPDRAGFCLECGARLALACPSCGTELPTSAKFCLACGSEVGAGLRSQLPDRDPRDYTPKHLADKILQSKSALEGERKQVTVLFADVKGSMDAAERPVSCGARIPGELGRNRRSR